MGSVNRITIVGHLGQDPELRYTGDGTAVCSLRIATTDTWTGKDGQKQEKTEWHQVSVWGKTAESCGQYLAKGRQVCVEGQLQTREYEDKEGITRKVWEIRANNVVFLGSGRAGGGEAGGGAGGRGGSGQGGQNVGGGGWGAKGDGGGGGAPGGRHGGSRGGQGGGGGGAAGGFDDPTPFAPFDP